MVDKGEGVQATTLANPSSKSHPSLNRQLELLGISKTAYYYKPIEPFSKSKDKKLLNAARQDSYKISLLRHKTQFKNFLIN
jgi:putative transposase